MRTGHWVFVVALVVVILSVRIAWNYVKLEVSNEDVSTVRSFINTMQIQNTKNDDEAFLIPSDDVLTGLSNTQQLQMLWRYINTVQVLCRNQIRLGSIKDGGKEICIDRAYVPDKPCLVYSFGSKLQTDFERAVIHNYGCEVHTFDPSVSLEGYKIPDGIHFHLYGLTDKDGVNKQSWKMRTLSSLMKQLNHTEKILDILKMDIEGSEWDALPEIIHSQYYKKVKQLSVEIHFHQAEARLKYLKVLRLLYEVGFRIFMREHNIHCIRNDLGRDTPISICNELSLINIGWR